jgi:Protein of unknown function (DUF3775)
MLNIAPEKVAHIIIRAREIDAQVDPWDQEDNQDDPEAILESRSGSVVTEELREFIADLNVDEQVSLVALMWIGRGTFEPEQLAEATRIAFSERVNPTEDYLLGVPMLAEFLEEGLGKLGISVEDAENGIL